MEKEITIEPRHFDAAMVGPWHVNTCLLAQVAIEHGLKLNDGSPNASVIERHSEIARKLRMAFDIERAVWRYEQSPRLKWIRATLPITVRIPESELE